MLLILDNHIVECRTSRGVSAEVFIEIILMCEGVFNVTRWAGKPDTNNIDSSVG